AASRGPRWWGAVPARRRAGALVGRPPSAAALRQRPGDRLSLSRRTGGVCGGPLAVGVAVLPCPDSLLGRAWPSGGHPGASGTPRADPAHAHRRPHPPVVGTRPPALGRGPRAGPPPAGRGRRLGRP